MGKNLVVCCDGTENRVTVNENSNVVHLYCCLKKDSSQITYYNPGVGTMVPEWVTHEDGKDSYLFKDKIGGISVKRNVMDAYIFLMDHYEDGDMVYLFGFSRGAYTVRMLSGLIEMYGLLYKGNQNHLNHLIHLYSREKQKFEIARKLKSNFSRDIKIRFMGIWDTVISVGSKFKINISFPFSRRLSGVQTVRHAVAIDERRKHFKYSEVNPNHNDLLEVFFAGVHSDVGGGYPKEGLSKIALEWMLGEASKHGLVLEKGKVDRYLYGIKSGYQMPDYTIQIHNPFKEDYRNIFSQIIPIRKGRFKTEGESGRLNLFKYWELSIVPKPRAISDGANLHESVIAKIKHKTADHNYQPENLDLENLGKYNFVKRGEIVYR